MANELTTKQEKFLKALFELKPRSRVVLEHRYCDFKNYQEISEILGLTLERARQLEKEGLNIIEKFT
jgi:RNA polymerase sigma factor (sigma-70 family)